MKGRNERRKVKGEIDGKENKKGKKEKKMGKDEIQ